MKITHIGPGHPLAPASEGGMEKKTGGPSFQSFLEKELQGTHPARPLEASSSASLATAPVNLRLDGLSLTEHTIATLEHFSAALANPAFRSSELEPFASALEEESAALADLKARLPEGDPLAALLERVATVSYLEAAKFRRGDYDA